MTPSPHWLTVGVHVPMWHIVAIVVVSIVVFIIIHSMDITEFTRLYGRRDVRVFDSKYTTLRIGDSIQPGDQIYTWTTPECTKLGWIPVPKEHWRKMYTKGMMEMRRKDVSAASARTNTINYHMCPTCASNFPSTQINCSICGYMV